jgi:hypothetical protein
VQLKGYIRVERLSTNSAASAAKRSYSRWALPLYAACTFGRLPPLLLDHFTLKKCGARGS